MKADTIITFASWEDRFYLGTEKNLQFCAPKNLYIYYYAEYADRTLDNRAKIDSLCAKKKIKLWSKEIVSEKSADTWRLYEKEFSMTEWVSKNVLVDISTMPRESIWSIFFFLEKVAAKVNYIYYKPERYNEDWLSRDPEKPRLLFKHSGISRLGRQTGLVIVTGFDPDRTLQLINCFDPKIVLLGIQTGTEFASNEKNLATHKVLLKGHTNVQMFDLDAYSKDHGQEIIENQIGKYVDQYNIIMSSLGPKPSAVALYKVCKKYPEVALVYAPSREFNLDYSNGIGKGITGDL